jgi:N-acetylmuramoyl-L-alanine amidase
MLKKSATFMAVVGAILMLPGLADISAQATDPAPIFPVLTGWAQQGEVQRYRADNLYEYIDGAADLYLTYDFQELQVAEYHDTKSASVVIEIYRFNTADQAFGIYSQERPGQWEYLTMGAQGYQEGPMLNFISNNYYVKISGSDIPDTATSVIKLIAAKTAEQLGGNPGLPRELKCFPAADLRLFSEKFINRNFLGYQFLHSGFVADYGIADRTYKLFIIKGQDKKDCAGMVQELRKKSTGQIVPVAEGDYLFTDPYLGTMLLTWRESYIWGVIGLQDVITRNLQSAALGKNIQRLWQSSAPVLQQGLEMGITFPAERDTIETSQIRLAAWVSDTAATVIIDNKVLPVYPSGAFVSLLDLRPGWNKFLLSARLDSSTITDSLKLYRSPPIPALAEVPTTFSPNFFIPADDLIFYIPDQITVQFMGSPGGSAGFKINDLIDDPLPMVELDPDESNGIKGLYRGIYLIQPGKYCEQEPLIFYLRGKDNKQKKWKTERLITVYQTGQPYLVETADESSLIYYQPDSEIFLELPRGIRLELIADYGRWLKVRIGSARSGYIRTAAVQRIGYGADLLQARCHGFSSRISNDWLTCTFDISRKVPFQLRQSLEPQSLELTFYNTNMQDEWSILPENDNLNNPDSSFLKNFEWQQTTDGALQIRFLLNTRQQWGFRGGYDNKSFKLMIRRPPVIRADNPFKNLIIALDAGHGGEQLGAVGATGYTEKEANLIYADFLAQLLTQAGARVILTRSADTTLTLKTRADLARQNNAHLLIWLHNNSTGANRDPLAVRGASTYYTQQQGQSIAQYVYPELLKLGLAPQGRVHRSYFITRQSDMIVFLVEGAFLSHPQDEIFLLNKDNLRKLASAVFRGLQKFLNTLAE